MFELIFPLAFIGIVLLLALKTYENAKGSKIFVFRTLSQFDTPIKGRIDKSKYFLEQMRSEFATFTMVELPLHTRHFVRKTRQAVTEKYATMLPNIRGNRTLHDNGKVSEYLKDIAKHKQENGGGSIE